MPRVKGGTVTRARRKRTLKLAKGYFGSKHLLYRTAHEQVMRSLRYSYIGRKQLKRDMRKLWIRTNQRSSENERYELFSADARLKAGRRYDQPQDVVGNRDSR